MATASCSRSSAGVKIVSNRRKNRLAAGPYDHSPSPPPPRSPNWLADAILHSALTLASGAGKILSSFLLSDSSSSEDVDSASENDAGDDNDYEFPSDEVDKLIRKNETSMQMIKDRQESQFSAKKSIIEMLIMQETFSREESNRLINIVKSRVMTYSTNEAGVSGLHTGSLRDIVGNDTVDLYNKDVMEAKIWFEETKKGLNAGLDLAHGTCGLNSTVVQPIESKVGPPVDVVESYMKKQNSLSSGSWNIHEVLRRVRLMATKDILCSPSVVSPKSGQKLLGSGIVAAGEGKKMIEPKEPKPIDPYLNLDAGMCPGVIGNQRRWNVSDKVNKENKRAAELKQERELKRLKSSVNYNGRKGQVGESENPSTI